MSIVIFDIDGTLADLTHRLHYIKNGNRNWKAFNELQHLDAPISQMIVLMQKLYGDSATGDQGYTILCVSGRGEETRAITEKWLYKHGAFPEQLYMRPAGDYRKDTIIKKEILDQIRIDYPNEEISFVVDDRTSVVKMWREQGLICLQCAEWEEEVSKPFVSTKGLLTLMVGPSGAGKSSWLNFPGGWPTILQNKLQQSQIINSDAIRQELCGDFRDQSKNAQVFAALRAMAKARIDNGLDVIIDATNIKRADRMSIIEATKPYKIRYIVIDRPLAEKQASGGWRNNLSIDLIGKHHESFQSQLKDILKGDGLPNVEVIDIRQS